MKKIIETIRRKWVEYLLDVIVIVGSILGAFALEEWNDNIKQNVREKRILTSLLEELIVDSLYIEQMIKNSERVMDSNKKVKKGLFNEQKTFNEAIELISRFKPSVVHLAFQNSSYLEIINSGDLKIIDSREIKNQLVSYYQLYDQAISHFRELNEWTAPNLTELLNNGIMRFYQPEEEYKELFIKKDESWKYMNDPYSKEFILLESTATMYAEKYRIFLGYFDRFKKKNNSLIESIRKEIDIR